jgi:hypothetical protein
MSVKITTKARQKLNQLSTGVENGELGKPVIRNWELVIGLLPRLQGAGLIPN